MNRQRLLLLNDLRFEYVSSDCNYPMTDIAPNEHRGSAKVPAFSRDPGVLGQHSQLRAGV
jgi:hypothetical protein